MDTAPPSISASSTAQALPPSVKITSPSNGQVITSSQVTVQFSVSDLGKVTFEAQATDNLTGVKEVEIKLPGGTWIQGSTATVELPPGKYTFEVKAVDNAGNVAWKNFTVSVSLGLSWNLLLDSSSVDSGTSVGSFTYTASLASGKHSLLLEATSNGGSASAEVNFTVDLGPQASSSASVKILPPQASLSGPSKYYVNKTSVGIAFSASDLGNVTFKISASGPLGVSKVVLQVGGLSYAVYSGSPRNGTFYYYLTLGPGNYSYEVLVYDPEGLSSSAGGTFSVSPGLRWTLLLNGTSVLSGSGEISEAYTLKDLSQGKQTLALEVTSAGGTASASLSFFVDTVPPAVTLRSPANNTLKYSSSPLVLTFTWSASDPGGNKSSGLAYYLLYLDGKLIYNGTSTNFTTSVSPGKHSWYVIAYDRAGNWNRSKEWNFEIAGVSSPPAVTLISPPNGKVFWTLNSSKEITFEVSISSQDPVVKAWIVVGGQNYTLPLTQGAGYNYTGTLSLTLGLGNYTWRAGAEDKAGLVGLSLNSTFSVEHDSISLEIISPPNGKVYWVTGTSKAVTISWWGDASSKIKHYGVDVFKGSTLVVSKSDLSPSQTSFTYTYGLGNYTAYVTAVDNAGNSTVAEVNFTVKQDSLGVHIYSPQGGKTYWTLGTEKNLTIAWKARSNATIEYFDVKVVQKEVTPSGISFTVLLDKTLPAGQTSLSYAFPVGAGYTVTVTAYDSAGFSSSASVSFSTAHDSLSLKISSPSAGKTFWTRSSSLNVTVKWNASSTAGLNYFIVKVYDVSTGTLVALRNITAGGVSFGTFSSTFTLEASPGGPQEYRAVVVMHDDAYPDFTASKEVNFTVGEDLLSLNIYSPKNGTTISTVSSSVSITVAWDGSATSGIKYYDVAVFEGSTSVVTSKSDYTQTSFTYAFSPGTYKVYVTLVSKGGHSLTHWISFEVVKVHDTMSLKILKPSQGGTEWINKNPGTVYFEWEGSAKLGPAYYLVKVIKKEVLYFSTYSSTVASANITASGNGTVTWSTSLAPTYYSSYYDYDYYVLNVTLVDKVGLKAYASVTFYVKLDTTPPSVKLLSPENGVVLQEFAANDTDSITLRWTGTDSQSGIKDYKVSWTVEYDRFVSSSSVSVVSTSSGSATTSSASYTLSILSAGAGSSDIVVVTWKVTAYDNAGNSATSSTWKFAFMPSNALLPISIKIVTPPNGSTAYGPENPAWDVSENSGGTPPLVVNLTWNVSTPLSSLGLKGPSWYVVEYKVYKDAYYPAYPYYTGWQYFNTSLAKAEESLLVKFEGGGPGSLYGACFWINLYAYEGNVEMASAETSFYHSRTLSEKVITLISPPNGTTYYVLSGENYNVTFVWNASVNSLTNYGQTLTYWEAFNLTRFNLKIDIFILYIGNKQIWFYCGGLGPNGYYNSTYNLKLSITGELVGYNALNKTYVYNLTYSVSISEGVGSYQWNVMGLNEAWHMYSLNGPFTLNIKTDTGPTVTLISPSNGGTTYTDVTFQWSGSSPVGIKEYKLYLDGNLVYQGTATSYSTTVTVGSHSWYVVAVDNLGVSKKSATWSFNVQKPKPIPPGPGPIPTSRSLGEPF